MVERNIWYLQELFASRTTFFMVTDQSAETQQLHSDRGWPRRQTLMMEIVLRDHAFLTFQKQEKKNLYDF